MRTARQILCTSFLVLLLPVILAESGFEASTDYDVCTDVELDTSFECFTQMPVFPKNYLICQATVTEAFLNKADISFTVLYGKTKRICKMDNRLVGNCSLRVYELSRPIQVCLVTVVMKQQCQECKKMTAIEIMKPEAPFDLKITYQEKANEYLVDFSTAHVSGSHLYEKLIHGLVYRQKNTNWTTKESQYVPFKLLGKELQPGTTYEVKVRSKPDGKYFKGTWSEWSPSEYLRTPDDYTSIVIIVSVVSFFLLLLLISLMPVYWKNRIKPIVWPTLPNHEKAMDKLCKKLRKNSDASFFNPENLGYVHIHKVDGIQAKPKLDCFQHSCLPCNTDILTKLGDELEQKNNAILLNQGWLKLPLAYEGMWPAEMLNRFSARNNPTTDGNTFIDGSLYCESEESSAGSPGSNSDTISSCFASPVDTIISGFEMDAHHHTYTNSESRVPNIEEAYVTMASFLENKRK